MAVVGSIPSPGQKTFVQHLAGSPQALGSYTRICLKFQKSTGAVLRNAVGWDKDMIPIARTALQDLGSLNRKGVIDLAEAQIHLAPLAKELGTDYLKKTVLDRHFQLAALLGTSSAFYPAINPEYLDTEIPKADRTNLEGKNLILCVNPGSQSTKVAIYADDLEVADLEIQHDANVLKAKKGQEELEFRKKVILDFLEEQGFEISQFSAIVGRGGFIQPNAGGIIKIDGQMLKDLEKPDLVHASNLGIPLAVELAKGTKIRTFTVDPVVTYGLQPEAIVSGLAGLERKCYSHALSLKAVLKLVAARLGISVQEGTFVGIYMGGGISIDLISGDRIIDTQDALLGDSFPFSPARGSAQVGDDITLALKMARDGADAKSILFGPFAKEGGIKSYLGTDQVLEVKGMIDKAKAIAADWGAAAEFAGEKEALIRLSNAGAKNLEAELAKEAEKLLTERKFFKEKNITDLAQVKDYLKGKFADYILRAMAYQISKQIGAMANSAKGKKIDAVYLTGGLARYEYLVQLIAKAVGRYGTRIFVYPGSREMYSMAEHANDVLTGKIEAGEYKPTHAYPNPPVLPRKLADEIKPDDLKIVRPSGRLPVIKNFNALVAEAVDICPPRTMAIADPNRESIIGSLWAMDKGLISKVYLVGSVEEIKELFEKIPQTRLSHPYDREEDDVKSLLEMYAGHFELVPVHHEPGKDKEYDQETSARAVELKVTGRVDLVQKGGGSSGPILKALFGQKQLVQGLATLTSFFELPGFKQLIALSDAGIVPNPLPKERVEITRNMAEVLTYLGQSPKIALLSHKEILNPKDPRSREQDEVANLSWPKEQLVVALSSLDVALIESTAKEKEVFGKNKVFGLANGLIVPDINSGNILYKTFTKIVHASVANVVTGIPSFVFTSRDDDARVRFLTTVLVSYLMELKGREKEKP